MVGRLNGRSVFDPRFAVGMAGVTEKSMTSSVLVRRRKPGAPTKFDFSTGVRSGDPDYDMLWTGRASVTPNKDWRARGYQFGSETTVFQAVAFQLPLARGTWNPDLADDQHVFRDEDQVIITANFFPNLDQISSYVYVVRNPLMSGTAFVQDLLCDVDLKSGFNIGHP